MQAELGGWHKHIGAGHAHPKITSQTQVGAPAVYPTIDRGDCDRPCLLDQIDRIAKVGRRGRSICRQR